MPRQVCDACAAALDLLLQVDRIQSIEMLMTITVIAYDVAGISNLAEHTVRCFVQVATHQEKYRVGMMPPQDVQDAFVNNSIGVEAVVEGQHDILSTHQPVARFTPEWVVNRIDAPLTGAHHEPRWRQIGPDE